MTVERLILIVLSMMLIAMSIGHIVEAVQACNAAGGALVQSINSGLACVPELK